MIFTILLCWILHHRDNIYIYEHILIEENQFLKNPNGIFQKIYKIILNLYEKKQYSKEIKIYIKDIINSAFEVELKDSVKSLYLELQQLFTKNSTNFFIVYVNVIHPFNLRL